MTTIELDWLPAPHAHRLATIALLAALAALLSGRAALLLLAAPPLAVLAADLATRRSRTLTIQITVTARRCFETEALEISVKTPGGVAGGGDLTLDLAVAWPFEIDTRPPPVSRTACGTVTRWTVRARRWGRHELPHLIIDCRSRHRTAQARTRVPLGHVRVFPAAAPVRPRLIPADLLRRFGEHVSRAAGSGVEFAGVRPYAPGDRARDINRQASGRRNGLYVTTRAEQRQTEIVLAVDAYSDLGPPGASTLDRAMRGAVSLASAYLRAGDRVGIVAFGGALRWLAPGQGEHHLYRLAEAVMDAGTLHSAVDPDIGRVPRTALPPGALVIAFSPLLDGRAARTIEDLRRRGNPVVVLDLLDHEPPTAGRAWYTALALRLWRLDRSALIAGLADIAVPVLPWTDTDLDSVLNSAFCGPRPASGPVRDRAPGAACGPAPLGRS